jgi:hypothetical protein
MNMYGMVLIIALAIVCTEKKRASKQLLERTISLGES